MKDATKTKRAGQFDDETHPHRARPQKQKGGLDHDSGETRKKLVQPPVNKIGEGQPSFEIQPSVADPDVTIVCDQLIKLGRQRNRIIQRKRLVDQPSEQEFVASIESRLPADHKLTKLQLYTQAKKIRDAALKHVPGKWGMKLWADADSGSEFKQYMAEANGKLTDNELDIIIEQSRGINEEAAYLNLLKDKRTLLEKEIERLAKQLPVCDWWCSIKGCGSGGLGKLVGETGNLSNYANPGKVWKRLGLAPYNGKACSTWKREGGLSAADWVEVGYSPRRRSAMYTIGDALLKNKNEYVDLYNERKLRECEKAVKEGLVVVTITPATAKSWEEKGFPVPMVVEKAEKGHRTVMHIHNRAQLYMEKRLVRRLWEEWNR